MKKDERMKDKKIKFMGDRKGFVVVVNCCYYWEIVGFVSDSFFFSYLTNPSAWAGFDTRSFLSEV